MHPHSPNRSTFPSSVSDDMARLHASWIVTLPEASPLLRTFIEDPRLQSQAPPVTKAWTNSAIEFRAASLHPLGYNGSLPYIYSSVRVNAYFCIPHPTVEAAVLVAVRSLEAGRLLEAKNNCREVPSSCLKRTGCFPRAA